MTERFYFDTSIWLDFYEKRGENGKAAFKLIAKIIKEDWIIGYSDVNIRELKNLGYSQNQINELFRIVKPDNIKRLHIYKEQIKQANKISKIKDVPRIDVLQAILSRDNDFQLISRDKHFEKLKNITHARIPEDFI